jgi:hypothetical protein
LHEAGLTYQKPEREYFELSEEERQEWVRTEVPKIRAAVQKYRAILYFQDEANISLTALLAKTWAPCGRTPKQSVTGKRGGVAAMSAITSGGQLIKGHQAKTKAELSELTHTKLTATSHDPELLRGIFFRCCAAEFLHFN